MQNDLWQKNLSPGRIATLACLLEVTAPKPGNVHRGADFEDVTFVDFATSAVAVGQAIDANSNQPVGQTILAAIQQTKRIAKSNTNLGMVLLICPLAKCSGESIAADDVRQVLDAMSQTDCRDVYAAISLANPGGLGESREMDIRNSSHERSDLLAAMRLSAERDLIARQYANGFVEVFGQVSDALDDGLTRFDDLSQAIVFAHVKTMATFADTLIERKCGSKLALQSQTMASRVIDQFNQTGSVDCFWKDVADLDFWLRSDGHRRNPGTTADLIAAAIYVALRNNKLNPPF